MSREISNSSGAKRDLWCRGPSAFLLWCAPWLTFVLGCSTPPPLKTVLWTVSFAVMGAACLLNAARCGRVHCRYTGPFFILAAVASVAYGLGLLPLGPSGWKWIGAGTVIGALVLCCIPELFLGRYRRGKDSAA
jgi:hypothetical protein